MSIILRSGMNLGEMSAENDRKFLHECFVQTGLLGNARDVSSSKSILVGRTGSGKSAILLEIENSEENVIRIDPESLSLNYISNSDIIRFFEDHDIKMDVFYQLLWRHIFAVELIKSKQKLHDEKQTKNWVQNLFINLGGNPQKKKALEYLFEFGDSFWADTEERIREVIRNIESRFEGQAGFDLKGWISGFGKSTNAQTLSEVKEVIHKAQKVVDGVQIQELENVINLLSQDIFKDKHEKYYIIIDDLDVDWTHSHIRFKLIRALIDTIRKFRRLENVKILISMRSDLLHTVLEKTKSSGFQAEKYEDLFQPIVWSWDGLREVADQRIRYLFRDQYTNRIITINDVVAQKVGDSEGFQYILERTLDRPRDVISYMNECFEVGAGQHKMSNKVIRDAEALYSTKRLRSLSDEWREAFGDIEPLCKFLKKMGAKFHISEFDKAKADELCLSILDGVEEDIKIRAMNPECSAYLNGTMSEIGIRDSYLSIMYTVGVVGVKMDPFSTYEWSYRNHPTLDLSRMSDTTKFRVHPMLFKSLGIYADPKSAS